MANRIRCDACGSSDLKLVDAQGRVLPKEGAGVTQMRFFCRKCETHSYWIRPVNKTPSVQKRLGD